MTLIARIRFRGIPLYVGDLLLSREGSARAPVDIPAALDINAKIPKEIGRSIAGLRQKVNIFDDRLIVAWAGNFIQARALIRDIRDAVQNGATTHEHIGDVVNRTPKAERSDLSLIGTILSPHPNDPSLGIQSHFNYCAERVEIGEVEIRAAGTGADDLFELAPQLIEQFPPPAPTVETQEFVNWLMGQGYALAASFVGHETATGQNIVDWWGGAFELAAVSTGKFQKASNILHTIWYANLADSKKYEIRLKPKFIKYDYFGDAFVAQTLDVSFKNKNNIEAVIEDHSFRIYTPILKGQSSYDLANFDPPDFSHTTLCCFVYFEPQVPHLGNLVHVHHDGGGNMPIRVEKQSGGLDLRIHKDLVGTIESLISEATGIPAEFSAIG